MKAFVKDFFATPKKPIGLLVLIVLIATFFAGVYVLKVDPTAVPSHYDSVVQNNQYVVHELSGHQVFEQTFRVENNVDGLMFYIAPEQEFNDYNRDEETAFYEEIDRHPETSLSVYIRNDAGQMVFTQYFSKEELRSALTAKFARVYFEVLPLEKLKTYTLVVESNFHEDTPVRMFSSEYDFYKDGFLTVDGQARTDDLAFAISSPGGMYSIAVFWGMAIATVLAAAVVYVLACSSKYIKPHVLLFVAIVLFGMGYSALVTPGVVPDEVAHYQTAYRWSNVLTFTSSYDPYDDDYMLMRVEDADMSGLYMTINNQPSTNVTTYAHVIHNFLDMSDDSTLIKVPARRVGNIMQYIVPAIGITIGRSLGLGQVPTFYLARMLNLLVFAFLVSFALKKIPFGKNVLMAVSLLPIALHQACSLSYDSIITAMAFVFIAYSLYIAYTDNDIRWQDIAFLVVSGAFLSAAKAGIYICMFGLGILILMNRKIPLKKRLWALGITAVVMLAVFAIFNLVKVSSVVAGTQSTGQNYSLAYILTHPLVFLKKVVSTVFMYKEAYIFQTLGWPLGSLNIRCDHVIILFFPLLMVLSLLTPPQEMEHLKTKESKWQKPVFLLCIAASLLLLFAAIMSWTQVGSIYIVGFQGRYLLPLLPLALLLFRNRWTVTKRDLFRILTVCFVTLNALYYAEILAFTLLYF